MDSQSRLSVRDVRLEITGSQILVAHAQRVSFAFLDTQITIVLMDIMRGPDSQKPGVEVQQLQIFQILVRDGWRLVLQIAILFVIMINVTNVQIATLLLDHLKAQFALHRAMSQGMLRWRFVTKEHT